MSPKLQAIIAAKTGISPEQQDRIWAEAQENHRKLEGCPIHDFELILPAQPLRRRYRCRMCDGEIENSAHHWYKRGVADGEKNTF